MARRDADTIGFVTDVSLRFRLGRERGLASLAGAPFFEPVLREAVDMAAVRPGDNVVLMGGIDLRPIPWIASRCRSLLVLDDLPEDRLSRLESDARARGFSNVSFQWGAPESISAPQHTADRIVCVNTMFRCRKPRQVVRQLVLAAQHDAVIVCCEPSATLDGRTARKYSREADLPMDAHRALVSYARAASSHRAFTSEGVRSLLTDPSIESVDVKPSLHGLVLLSRCAVRF